jgi:hypothetical protein
MNPSPTHPNLKYVGLDVHAETSAVALADATGLARSSGIIAAHTHAVNRLVKWGDYVRRFKERLGNAEGIVPGAHKLARILWSLIASGAALRLAAQSLWRAKNYFGELYRRWKARLGSPKAITAMAHKLARVLWHMLKFREPFNPEVFKLEEQKLEHRKLNRLQSLASFLNYRLVQI